eukprot:8462198-Pyramimonas_sp.AAC.1
MVQSVRPLSQVADMELPMVAHCFNAHSTNAVRPTSHANKVRSQPHEQMSKLESQRFSLGLIGWFQLTRGLIRGLRRNLGPSHCEVFPPR